MVACFVVVLLLAVCIRVSQMIVPKVNLVPQQPQRWLANVYLSYVLIVCCLGARCQVLELEPVCLQKLLQSSGVKLDGVGRRRSFEARTTAAYLRPGKG